MEIDKLFKQKLASREVNANADLFNKIEAKLDASSAGNGVTSSAQTATSALTTAAKVTLISIAAAAVATGGYFVVDNLTKDADKTIAKEVVLEQKMTNDVEQIVAAEKENTTEITSNNAATADKVAIMTDFTDQIVTSNNSNITIEFDQPQKSNTTAALQNYEPNIKKASAKEDVSEVTAANNPVQTPTNRGKQAEKVTLSSKLHIPNIITPNDDGINDYFVIGDLSLYPDNVLVIWNRSGKQIFSASHYQNDWNAQNLPAGMYMYKLLLRTEDESEIKQGIIEVMR
ncbi:MAG: gliding motility-associated C-terminal domain-containing protein [Bacteroidales bacterium]|jgi:gliding motility-associated-like protein|nr:gliding motility-associated C-terminal domain-containing protein [Bacteroidales bacterium]